VMVEKLNSSNLGADTTCLICLSSIKRLQPIWNCSQCFCSFHLECIQQWVTDGSKIQSLLSVELFPDQEVTWSCPKCRHDYPHSSCPRSYYCYCGKVQNPPDDPWLLSHSCGKQCDRPLLPLCGHRCVSLCHPGPCLPCPRTVSVRCYCGRGDDIMRRCGSKGWSCGRVCRKVLSCDQHVCESICHEGMIMIT
jgi:NF-X1-type zinc finger protein NFXL1